MEWDFLSWKKARLAYILLRDNDPAHVLLIPHTPLPLPGVASPQIDILGELRDSHHPKNCLSFLF